MDLGHLPSEELLTAIQGIPRRTMNVVTGTGNQMRGQLGELIGYLDLKARYDRIIPLGTIVDFMCIKFPQGDDPGKVDFIDIKTGSSARLSGDQRQLQKLIENKDINFIKVHIKATNVQDISGTD